MRNYLWISILAEACGGNDPVVVTGDDCDSDAACVLSEVCSGGGDEDMNGLADCEDPICFEDPICYDFKDSADLPGPDGHPSADIEKLGVDLTVGTATFFVTTYSPWPPPAETYSWFVTFEIDNDGNSPVAAVTVRRLDGVDSINPLGIPAGNITIRQTAEGIWARMTGVPSTGVKFYVESGIQRTNPGTRVTDTVVGAPADLP